MVDVSWVIKVKAAAHLDPIIVGNIYTTRDEGRSAATTKAWKFVRKHFDERAKIVGIARGKLTLKLNSEWEDIDEAT